LPGWQKSTKGVKNYSELPKEAKDYVKELEKEIGVKVKYISTGQSRYEIITV